MLKSKHTSPNFRLGSIAGVLLFLWLPVPRSANADPPLRCLWSPSHSRRVILRRGVASIQYTQFFDDDLVRALSQVLGPDRALRFRYERDYPDDHVFPNGVSMQQLHQWLTRMIDAWDGEPLMPLRLQLERGHPDTENVIRLDDNSSETPPNSGVGGYTYIQQNGKIQFRSRAVINVDAGSVSSRERFEALAKHELGHCLTLRHSSSRASVMGYSTGSVDYGSSVGYFALDDLLGLRSVWARNSPGFGALRGRLLYPDGSIVGGGDVVAVEDGTGEVLATGVSDIQQDGRFRIELPAGRRVRLAAHPLHSDALLFGDHFLPPELLTPETFAPTEFSSGDRAVVFTVPDSTTQDLDPLTVVAPSDPPLLNKNAPVAALLPGDRQHLAMQFDGLGGAEPQVILSLNGLTASRLTTAGDRVEFDVTAAPDVAGVSTVQIRVGSAANLQVGSVWVRPLAGLVRATSADPPLVVRGKATEVVVKGLGLDRVRGVRAVSAMGEKELPIRLVGPSPGGGLTVAVTPSADAADGPWELRLVTAEGEAPASPEPRPRLWVGSGRLRLEAKIDLGDRPVGQPVELSVPLTNLSGSSYHVTDARWTSWRGDADVTDFTTPEVAPGASDALHLKLTPKQLGPLAITLEWMAGGQLDGVTEVRLWGIPPGAGG